MPPELLPVTAAPGEAACLGAAVRHACDRFGAVCWSCRRCCDPQDCNPTCLELQGVQLGSEAAFAFQRGRRGNIHDRAGRIWRASSPPPFECQCQIFPPRSSRDCSHFRRLFDVSPFADCTSSKLNSRLVDLIVCPKKQSHANTDYSSSLFQENFVKQLQGAERQRKSNHSANNFTTE